MVTHSSNLNVGNITVIVLWATNGPRIETDLTLKQKLAEYLSPEDRSFLESVQ